MKYLDYVMPNVVTVPQETVLLVIAPHGLSLLKVFLKV